MFGRIIIFTKELYQKHHKETDHDAQKLLHEMITLEEVRITYLEKSRYVPALLPLEHLKHDDIDDGAAGKTWGRGIYKSWSWYRTQMHLVAQQR